MQRRRSLAVRAVLFTCVCAAGAPFAAAQPNGPAQGAVDLRAAAAAPDSPAAKLEFGNDVNPLFAKYCITCHSGPTPSGDLNLQFRDEQEVKLKVAADKEFWPRVVGMLSSKEMPPEDAPAIPSSVERELLVNWIYSDVLAVNCDDAPNPGKFRIRRLNNREYANTIRDLLYLPSDWNAAADFPADERGVGFDNNGDTLTISPVLIEHYVSAAEKAVDFAMNKFGQGSRESQRRLNAPRAEYREDFADWQAEARVVVELFAPRAYRRPVTKEEVDDLMRFAAISFAHDGESIDAASSLAMRAALLSPEFLFRMERDPTPDGSGKVFQISEYELASRLSYFLWATMPDDDLFDAAGQGKLRETLDVQIKRMLQDPKAISLTKDFAGQWLEIRGLDQTANCPPELLAAMQGETEHFFNHIIRQDRSIMEFLNADYTFLNETLARHYGIEGISGSEFRQVQVDTSKRGGIFTHASFLTLTGKPLGDSRRTSPVNRGKWILENIFNTTIPPPPPDVPALEIDDSVELKGTVRQIFEQHRADPKCASCHARMDPYGFALENYDGYGAWRTHENNAAVDASGEIDGRPFSTPLEFRAILAARQDSFRRAFVEKLLQYALGRGIEAFDKCAVDEICAAVESEGNRFSSVILNLVRSAPFQYARGSAISSEQLLAAEQAEAKARTEAEARAQVQARVAAEAREAAAFQQLVENEAAARAELVAKMLADAKLRSDGLSTLESTAKGQEARTHQSTPNEQPQIAVLSAIEASARARVAAIVKAEAEAKAAAEAAALASSRRGRRGQRGLRGQRGNQAVGERRGRGRRGLQSPRGEQAEQQLGDPAGILLQLQDEPAAQPAAERDGNE